MSKVIRFIVTGVVAAIFGTILFFLLGIFLAVLFSSSINGYGGGDPPQLWVWCNLIIVYLVCMLVPWEVSRQRLALAGRWACPLAYGGVWLLLQHMVNEAQKAINFLPAFLAGAVFVIFFSGDLGDRARLREEKERMKRESEVLDCVALRQSPKGGKSHAK